MVLASGGMRGDVTTIMVLALAGAGGCRGSQDELGVQSADATSTGATSGGGDEGTAQAGSDASSGTSELPAPTTSGVVTSMRAARGRTASSRATSGSMLPQPARIAMEALAR